MAQANINLLKEIVHELGHLNLMVDHDSIANHVLNRETERLWNEIHRLEETDEAIARQKELHG